MNSGAPLRAYTPGDEEACIALWLRSWQATYPQIDFTARLDWWRKRWRGELVPHTAIAVAEDEGRILGFVTVDPRTLYLDQLVVAPELWGKDLGAALVAEAKRLSPTGLDLDVNTDNARAVAFYRKCGFTITGSGVNATSGRPIHHMSWRP